MSLSDARRNQMLIAALSTLLLVVLWSVGDLPTSMNYALIGVVAAIWVPAFLAHKQREGSVAWNSFFGLLGVVVLAVVVRAVWLIGRG